VRNISDQLCRKKQNTHFVFSEVFFEKHFVFSLDNVEKYFRTGHAADDNMVHELCMLAN
jgi:hypothetical protein